MRFAIGLLGLILTASSVSAQDANARAEKEARAWLKPCKEKMAIDQNSCLEHQQNFTEQYVYAKSGDLYAMGSMSLTFGPPSGDEVSRHLWIGSPQSVVQSCAWQITRAQSTGGDAVIEKTVVRTRCGSLSPNEQVAALERADQLLAELRHAPAKTPDEDWEPKIAGLAPSPKIDPRCLDSTLAPLDDSPVTLFVPPKGCPDFKKP